MNLKNIIGRNKNHSKISDLIYQVFIQNEAARERLWNLPETSVGKPCSLLGKILYSWKGP